MSIKTALYSAIIITTITASFYVYYQSSQHKISALTEANMKLSLAVQEQARTIATIQEKYKQQTAALNALSVSNATLSVEKDALSTKLMKHDLEELSKRKPALVESRINNGTKELFSSLTALSTK